MTRSPASSKVASPPRPPPVCLPNPFALSGVKTLDRARVLDIRQDTEHGAGHVFGTVHVELGALAALVEDMPKEPLVVMCGHGERAMGAASLMDRAGHHNVTVLDGGPQDWADKSGSALVVGQ